MGVGAHFTGRGTFYSGVGVGSHVNLGYGNGVGRGTFYLRVGQILFWGRVGHVLLWARDTFCSGGRGTLYCVVRAHFIVG